MATKRTNKEMYVALLAIVANAEMSETDRTDMTDFINSRIEQIDKKASTISKAEREKAEKNAEIARLIIEGLGTVGKPVKVSDLIKGYDLLNGYSTQKLTPIMKNLVDNGKIEVAKVKRENLYSIKIA